MESALLAVGAIVLFVVVMTVGYLGLGWLYARRDRQRHDAKKDQSTGH